MSTCIRTAIIAITCLSAISSMLGVASRAMRMADAQKKREQAQSMYDKHKCGEVAAIKSTMCPSAVKDLEDANQEILALQNEA